MGKILYLECNSGISGDMTVGALLDLGADRAVLERALESLGVDGYHLHFGRKVVCGLDAFDFDVHLEDGEGHGHIHDCEDPHCHAHEHADEHAHEHIHEHADEHAHEHIHEHAHEHTHEPGHEHTHGHTHVHRNLFDIYRIIDQLDSGDHVKELARRMFRIVAEAESKAHGLPLEEVHFHEVGAIDSIVDIISVAVCVDNLGISEVVVSPLSEGYGHVHCQHGILPVPVPATANIASAYGLNLRLTDNEGEMVTPTGAAIAAALRTMDRLPASCRLLKVGMGAGNKVFKQANVLRAMLLETDGEAAVGNDNGGNCNLRNDNGKNEDGGQNDSMWVLESNLDDCTGEMLGFTMELLLEAGAADVWYTSIYMKKNRPAYMLNVLCRETDREKMEEIILVHTTTIGIRQYPVTRTILAREKVTVDTEHGPADVKVCSYKGRTFFYPEYESVRAICRKTGLDFQTVYQEVRMEAGKKGNG